MRRKKISKKEIADRLGITRQAVHRWFSGQSMPSLENLQKLAKMHEVTIEKMIDILKKK